MLDKNQLLEKLGDTGTLNRLTGIAADYEVPAWKKMLTWLTIWFWVKKIRRRLIERSVKSHSRQAFG